MFYHDRNTEKDSIWHLFIYCNLNTIVQRYTEIIIIHYVIFHTNKQRMRKRARDIEKIKHAQDQPRLLIQMWSKGVLIWGAFFFLMKAHNFLKRTVFCTRRYEFKTNGTFYFDICTLCLINFECVRVWLISVDKKARKRCLSSRTFVEN